MEMISVGQQVESDCRLFVIHKIDILPDLPYIPATSRKSGPDPPPPWGSLGTEYRRVSWCTDQRDYRHGGRGPPHSRGMTSNTSLCPGWWRSTSHWATSPIPSAPVIWMPDLIAHRATWWAMLSPELLSARNTRNLLSSPLRSHDSLEAQLRATQSSS